MTRDEFLKRFDRLHDALRFAIGDSRASFEDCLAEVQQMRELSHGDVGFLRQCQRIRNFFAHGHHFAADLFSIGFNPTCSRRLEALIGRLEGDRSVGAAMVPWQKVAAAGPEQPILPLMASMIARGYSHLPVIENGRVTAVFDERVLFLAVANGRVSRIGDDTTVGDVVVGFRFDGVDCHDLGVTFCGRGTALHELRATFDRHLDERDRISLAVITETGRSSERPLGILTIWDLMDLDL